MKWHENLPVPGDRVIVTNPNLASYGMAGKITRIRNRSRPIAGSVDRFLHITLINKQAVCVKEIYGAVEVIEAKYKD